MNHTTNKDALKSTLHNHTGNTLRLRRLDIDTYYDDVEGLWRHYALTLRHWVRRLEQRKAKACYHVREDIYRVWCLDIAACALEFEAGDTAVYQILASRRAIGTHPVPLTRCDLYYPNPTGEIA